MNAPSPASAYFEATRLYPEINEIEDPEERVRRMGALAERWRECVAALQAVAGSDDPEVWFALGDAHQNGRGVTRDREEAMRWFSRAAEAGHTRAMVRLGRILCQTTDFREAGLDWLRKAADAGDPAGMVCLGFAYRDSDGVAQDYQEALRWFRKAVEAGHAQSMILVARMHAWFLKEPAEAIPWLLRAAEAGINESYLLLATIYKDRDTALYDPKEAVKWYLKATEEKRGGSATAMFALAQCYRNGEGVPQDRTVARQWLERILEVVPQNSETRRSAQRLIREIEEEVL